MSNFKSLSTDSSRRDFFLGTAGLSAATWAALASKTHAEKHAQRTPIIQRGTTVLFQGDSITDTKRDRATADKPNHQPALGKGYAWLASAELLVSRPEEDLKFFNRGISGNKVYQLAKRWQEDCLDLKPDVLSILIGVNDIWHKLAGKYDGTVEVYEKDYHALLKRTKKALPAVKLVVCEPFVLRCGAVDDSWFPEFDEYRTAAKRVADEARAIFVPFQTMFDRAIKHAPAEHLAKDGVHPTSHGAALMASAWVAAVSV